MRCCGSRTTSIAPEPALRAPADAARVSARAIAAQFEAVLFAKALAPVAAAMGFYGDAVVASAVAALTRAASER